MNDLKRRIVDISYENKLSHLGSCLTAVDLIETVYKIKEVDEPFVLSSGHAHLAHLVVREKYEGKKIGKIHDIHCNVKDGCDVSTGSLGQGLPIALGMALADRTRRVFCVISDGELAEGSIWESMRIIVERHITNLIILINVNGYAAYKKTNGSRLYDGLKGFGLWVDIYGAGEARLEKALRKRLNYPTVYFVRTTVKQLPFLKGQLAHYKVMTKEEYETAIR